MLGLNVFLKEDVPKFEDSGGTPNVGQLRHTKTDVFQERRDTYRQDVNQFGIFHFFGVRIAI